MDSQFSLSSLSHTSTPKKLHTCNPQILSSLYPADDGEDAGDDETDGGVGADVDGQNRTAAMEEFGGKLYFSAEEDEETNGDLEAETGEIHNYSHSHGFGEGKGGILARKEVDLHTSSSSLGLGFRAAVEYEPTLG
ncbi:UNVERIFIED_CONTAM: hypothetical protein Sindi_3017200 [Sesamum indicum]